MVHLITPETDAEFERYYQFRWRLLRAPHKLPPGSERDEYDTIATHRMLVDEAGNTIAVARMHQISTEEAQLRYIAVDDDYQQRGLGSKLVAVMEEIAHEMGVSRILINARLNAIDFYQKCGFHLVGEGPTHSDRIQHQQMRKDLARINCSIHCNEWGDALSLMWRNELPAASRMELEVESYDGATLVTTAPLKPNSGSDGHMFSGSIFGMCNLTGWGAIRLALKSYKIDTDINLISAKIDMLASISGKPMASASGEIVKTKLSEIAKKRQAEVSIVVELYDEQQLAVRFNGNYIVQIK